VVETFVLLDARLLQQSELGPNVHLEVFGFFQSQFIQACRHSYLKGATLNQKYSVRLITDLVNDFASHALDGCEEVKQSFELI
jgi:hypothetical protein